MVSSLRSPLLLLCFCAEKEITTFVTLFTMVKLDSCMDDSSLPALEN